MIIARRWIADLAASEQQRGVLVEVCLQAASRRYSELTDYLRRRRLKLPGARDDDVPDVDDLDGEIPR